jgi:hypothetical protein
MNLKMKLTRPANKGGGDRYECTLNNGNQFVLYLPQEISRDRGVPMKHIEIIIQETNG